MFKVTDSKFRLIGGCAYIVAVGGKNRKHAKIAITGQRPKTAALLDKRGNLSIIGTPIDGSDAALAPWVLAVEQKDGSFEYMEEEHETSFVG